MTGTRNSLVEDVQRRLLEDAAKQQAADEALIAAERLSDQYGDIRPDPFYLPLDALAGFTSSRSDQDDPWLE
jgi:hypothetical protein